MRTGHSTTRHTGRAHNPRKETRLERPLCSDWWLPASLSLRGLILMETALSLFGHPARVGDTNQPHGDTGEVLRKPSPLTTIK